MQTITCTPIAFVSNTRLIPDDDYWGGIISTITLTDEFDQEAFLGLSGFSHVEILFHFHQVAAAEIILTAAIPREQADKYPRLGVFAQRKKLRPNRLGATCCEIVKIEGTVLTVRGLDAINGTPVLDIKPVLKQFLPEHITQPPWVDELMKDYWK